MATQHWALEQLACPQDHAELSRHPTRLGGPCGHEYPVTNDVPVLLVQDADPTHPYCARTYESLHASPAPPSDAAPAAVDPYVQDELVRTHGLLYTKTGPLTRYPIPDFRLPAGEGRSLLDVGSNWGRWTISASRAGYRAVGLDPWIEAARAGQRVAEELGEDVGFVVGDARYLPFRDATFDVSFSYSVLQHFDKSAARRALREMARVTRPGGVVCVQMPNVLGARQAFNWLRNNLRKERPQFRVRYWTPWELLETFRCEVGRARLEADCYFSLNAQAADLDLLPQPYASVVQVSEALRRASRTVTPLRYLADSVYVIAERRY